MSYPLNRGDAVMVGYSDRNVYSNQPDVKYICVTLALRGLRFIELKTGCYFTHIAIAYAFQHFIEFLMFYLHFSGGLHTRPAGPFRHLTVRYYTVEDYIIHSLHIYVDWNYKVRLFYSI